MKPNTFRHIPKIELASGSLGSYLGLYKPKFSAGTCKEQYHKDVPALIDAGVDS